MEQQRYRDQVWGTWWVKAGNGFEYRWCWCFAPVVVEMYGDSGPRVLALARVEGRVKIVKDGNYKGQEMFMVIVGGHA